MIPIRVAILTASDCCSRGQAIETLRGEVQDDGRPDAVSITGRFIHHGDAG